MEHAPGLILCFRCNSPPRIPLSSCHFPGLGDALCDHLETLGLSHSTAIQAAAVPDILRGEDLVIGAETGSGKTLAYLLPIVERLLRGLAVSEELPDELLGMCCGWRGPACDHVVYQPGLYRGFELEFLEK